MNAENVSISGVPETMLQTMVARAVYSQKPDHKFAVSHLSGAGEDSAGQEPVQQAGDLREMKMETTDASERMKERRINCGGWRQAFRRGDDSRLHGPFCSENPAAEAAAQRLGGSAGIWMNQMKAMKNGTGRTYHGASFR